MPQLGKYNSSGEMLEEIDLREDIFQEEINEPVVHEVVNAQLAARRQGNASTKTRPEKRGGGRKPWRQKGTGRARHGSIRSPLWVGGGVTFGPKPRSYEKKVNRKVKKLAYRSILSSKYENEELKIIDKLEFAEPKTREARKLLEKLGLAEKKVLVILPEKDENSYLSFRNLPRVKTMVAEAVNAFDLLNNEMILLPEAALAKLEEVLINE